MITIPVYSGTILNVLADTFHLHHKVPFMSGLGSEPGGAGDTEHALCPVQAF